MRIHALQTGTVAIKQRQVHGVGQGMQCRLNTLFDHTWTEPLPIYVWVIEHPEGVIVVDTGETARVTEPGYFPLSRTEYQYASGWRGQVRGYLPQQWPMWFAPTLIDFAPAAVGLFPGAFP